jgi:hypothetical protein
VTDSGELDPAGLEDLQLPGDALNTDTPLDQPQREDDAGTGTPLDQPQYGFGGGQTCPFCGTAMPCGAHRAGG